MVTHVLCHLSHVGRHWGHRRHGVRRWLRRGRVMSQVLSYEVVGTVVERVLGALRVAYGVVDIGDVCFSGAGLPTRLWHSRLRKYRFQGRIHIKRVSRHPSARTLTEKHKITAF